ncbi:isochorismate synthase [Fructilactobacillus carniphilus]|uniref:isochorismate synthase n=1 Tax=Fructilactobacillus carniphilus TaxID=2940297 RepID=A0ABY5BXG7_9LACO|nr:isochorismate synthase [Fructilactobacillus carniphilus]USS90525.1 isochorismate synthase [Fructilactobacillus carniphilus]
MVTNSNLTIGMKHMNSQTTAFLADFDNYHTAVYFSDPQHQVELIGLGETSTLHHFTLAELTAWHAHQSVPVFGGLPFDQQLQPTSNLMNGIMIAPAYVINLASGEEWGTRPAPDYKQSPRTHPLHILNHTTETDWQARLQPVLHTLQTDPQKQKVVLGMQEHFDLDGQLSASQLIKTLIRQQPQTYHVAIKHGDELFGSATPERLVKLNQNQLETAAVAGSIARGQTDKADQKLAHELQRDAKNQREHQLVVTEIERRLQPWAQLDSVAAPEILTTPQIQHLYTPITGTIKQTASVWQIVQALHPTPALGGLPVDWALATIANVESQPRGLFAAPVGYVMPDGSGEFVIGIRSLWSKDHTVNLFAGAGILAASDLTAEEREIQLKTTAMENILKEQLDDERHDQ